VYCGQSPLKRLIGCTQLNTAHTCKSFRVSTHKVAGGSTETLASVYQTT